MKVDVFTTTNDHALAALTCANTPRSRSTTVVLGAQLVGVAAQAAFHLGGDAVAPLLTEARTSLIDHVVSNVGVACLAGQAACWIKTRTAWTTLPRRVMLAGAVVQVAGALIDAVGHVRGGEQPVGFALIGTGYLLVAGGALAARRANRYA